MSLAVSRAKVAGLHDTYTNLELNDDDEVIDLFCVCFMASVYL
jgi:hypothetical protein